MARFKIGQAEYETDLFAEEKQPYVQKRLLPTLLATAQCLAQLSSLREEGLPTSLEGFLLSAEPVALALSKMDDRDLDYVLISCCEMTRRKVEIGVGWVSLLKSGDEFDKKFSTRLHIAWYVLRENFADFFASFGMDLSGIMPTTPFVQ